MGGMTKSEEERFRSGEGGKAVGVEAKGIEEIGLEDPDMERAALSKVDEG